MCDACEDWEAREPRQGVPPQRARRAREIERNMPGLPVPDATWRIALGQSSGAIPWAEHLRILTAFQTAASSEHRFLTGSRPSTRLACDAPV